MKRLTIPLYISLGLLLSSTINSFAQDYSRKFYGSIHHYAERMLGSKIVENKEQVDFRKGAIYYFKELDLPGNYAHVAGGYAGDYYLALWKMKNGNDLLGVTHYNCQAACLYECSFFEFSQNDSSEVSTEVLPIKKMVKHLNKMKLKAIGASGNMDDETAQFKFIMPQGSGPLIVEISMDRNRIEFPILSLEWSGEKFAIKVKYKELPSS